METIGSAEPLPTIWFCAMGFLQGSRAVWAGVRCRNTILQVPTSVGHSTFKPREGQPSQGSIGAEALGTPQTYLGFLPRWEKGNVPPSPRLAVPEKPGSRLLPTPSPANANQMAGCLVRAWGAWRTGEIGRGLGFQNQSQSGGRVEPGASPETWILGQPL